MINNNLKTGMKKLNLKEKLGKKNIIKNIKKVSFKSIRLGRKKMWINPVPSGGCMDDGEGFGTLTWIKNIVSGRRLG